MSSTTFINGTTLSDADWFNDLNRLHYTIFSDPADMAAVRTAITAGNPSWNIGTGTLTAGAGNFTATSAVAGAFTRATSGGDVLTWTGSAGSAKVGYLYSDASVISIGGAGNGGSGLGNLSFSASALTLYSPDQSKTAALSNTGLAVSGTLSATGSVGVGTASLVANHQLTVKALAANYAQIALVGGDTSTQWELSAFNDGSKFFIGYNNSALATLDASGNLGLGVSPSAWATLKGIEIGALGSSISGNNAGLYLSEMVYYNAGWKYAQSGFAAGQYAITNGSHNWYTAASGTAGNAITWTTAMTLDSNANLTVGKGGTGNSFDQITISGSNATGYGPGLNFNGNGSAVAYVGDYAAIVGGATHQLLCRNTSGGVYLSGGGATSWTAVSDERFKENFEPITNAVDKVMTLRTVVGNYIESFDPSKTRKPFLIAQDVLAVLPEAVSTENPDQLGLSMTDTIPLLAAAIKEQQALIQSLTARVQQLEAHP